jgi:dTDP-glucose 4,6-dehydratase
MPQSFLITGAAGFIGSHFALRHVALHPEDSVTVLDALTYAGNKSYLDPIISNISFQKGDIADTALVASLVAERNIDTIVNFAAETHVDRSIADAHPFLHTNVLGTQSLIEVCRQHPVRLLHVSTDEVYGDLTDTERPKRTDEYLSAENDAALPEYRQRIV